MSRLSPYTTTLTHPTYGSRVIQPIVNDYALKAKLVEKEKFRRRSMETTIVLDGVDYMWLKAIDDDPTLRCEDVTFVITTVIGGTTYTPFEGVVKVPQVKFNERAGIANFKPLPDDDYREMYENWETEHNILTGTNTTVYGLLGDLEAIRCEDNAYSGSLPSRVSPYTTIDSCISPGEGYVVFRLEYGFGIPGPDYIRTTWIREKVTGSVSEPIGNGWIDLGGGDWAREPQISAVPVEIVNTYDSNTNVLVYDAYFPLSGVGLVYDVTGDIEDDGFDEVLPGTNLYYKPAVYDNGATLEEALGILNPITGGTFISDFFGINPDSTNPSNDAYVEALAYHQNLVLHDITDVSQWNATNNATIGEISFKDLYETLKNKYNVFLRITGTSIRIEHESYWTLTQGLDLTQPEYARRVRGRNEYDYGDTDLPKEEKFTGLDSPVSGYFEGVPITYSKCITEDSPIEPYDTPLVITDIGFIGEKMENEDTKSQISREGFTLMAAGESGGFLYLVQTNGYSNERLSMTVLHDKMWRHGRPQIEGNMNGADETFTTKKRTKRQQNISIKLNRLELMTYDPDELMKTVYGWGEVEEVTMSLASGELQIILRHD